MLGIMMIVSIMIMREIGAQRDNQVVCPNCWEISKEHADDTAEMCRGEGVIINLVIFIIYVVMKILMTILQKFNIVLC